MITMMMKINMKMMMRKIDQSRALVNRLMDMKVVRKREIKRTIENNRIRGERHREVRMKMVRLQVTEAVTLKIMSTLKSLLK